LFVLFRLQCSRFVCVQHESSFYLVRFAHSLGSFHVAELRYQLKPSVCCACVRLALCASHVHPVVAYDISVDSAQCNVLICVESECTPCFRCLFSESTQTSQVLFRLFGGAVLHCCACDRNFSSQFVRTNGGSYEHDLALPKLVLMNSAIGSRTFLFCPQAKIIC